MAPEDRSIENLRKRIDLGYEGVDPKTQTQARTTSNPRAAAHAQKAITAQQKANATREESDIADQQREAEKQQRQQVVDQNKAARAQEAAARHQQAVAVRQAAAAGAETTTDIETGRRSIATHPDGAPKFKAGPIGGPVEVGTATPTLSDPTTGETRAVPNTGIMLGGEGATSATGSETRAIVGQPVRNDRGGIQITAPDTKTDKTTGRTYTESKDPTTGLTTKTAVGIDDAARKSAELATKVDAVALQKNQIAQARLAFDAEHAPIKDAYSKAEKRVKALPPIQQDDAGNWVRISEQTGEAHPVDDFTLTRFQKEKAQADAQFADASKKAEPFTQREAALSAAEHQAKSDHLRLEAERIRNDMQLPGNDGGVSRVLAQEATGDNPYGKFLQEFGIEATDATATPEEQAQKAQETKDAALLEEAQNPLDTTRPRIPVNESAAAALGTLKGVEGLTVTPDGGLGFVKDADGKWLASVTPERGGLTVLTLRDEALQNKNIVDLLQFDKAGNELPLFIRENLERPTLKETARWATKVMAATLPEAPAGSAMLGGDGAASAMGTVQAVTDVPATEAERGLMLEKLGATPDQIKRKVAAGEIPMQVGRDLLKNLYNDTLVPDRFDDPASRQKWIEETTKREIANGVKPDQTTAARWKSATARNSNANAILGPLSSLWSTYSLSEQNEIERDRVADYAAANLGKPGVTRDQVKALYRRDAGDEATVGETINSWSTAMGKTGKYDAGAAMAGMAAGLIADLGKYEVAMIGRYANMVGLQNETGDKAAADLMESLGLRNRDFANFANGTKRNIKRWFTPEGQQKSIALENAIRNLQTTIDADEEAPVKNPDAVRAAEIQVRNAALELHGLAPDDSWPITADSLDPDKDMALGAALARYAATADPRQLALYKDRLLMSNGRRQFSSAIEQKTRGLGRAGQSFVGGMSVGWQELIAEVAADASFGVGGFVAATAGARALKAAEIAGTTARAGRIGRAATAVTGTVAKWERAGIKVGTLAKPLTGAERFSNLMVKGGKLVAQGSLVGEPLEEMVVELGADDPNFGQAYLGGMMGSVVMLPIFAGISKVAGAMATAPEQAKFEQRIGKWTQHYNTTYAGTPGFKPVTVETARTAAMLVNGRASGTLANRLVAAQKLLGLTDEQVKITPEESNAATNAADRIKQTTAETDTASRQTANLATQQQNLERKLRDKKLTPQQKTRLEGELRNTNNRIAAIEQAAPARNQTIDESNTAIQRTNAKLMLQQIVQDTAAQIAEAEVNAVDAVNAIADETDPARKTYLQGMAKVASGNAHLLTKNERSAIQGATTQAGAAYFDSTIDEATGSVTEQISAEGRAELMEKHPAIGRLVQTDASRALVEQSLMPATGAADTPVQAGSNLERVATTPEHQAAAAQVAKQVKSKIAAIAPQIAANVGESSPMPNRVTGGVSADFNAQTGVLAISLIPDDIAQAIAKGADPAKLVDELTDIAILHETLHVLQFKRAAESGANFQQAYTSLYNEMTPEMLAYGRNLYGATNWDTLEPWQRAAEVERMFAEAALAGRVTDIHQFTQGAPPSILARFAEIIKDLIEAITTGVVTDKDGKVLFTLPPSFKAQVENLTALYQELLNAPATPDQSTADPANRQQQPTPGQTGDGTGSPAEKAGNPQAATPSTPEPTPGDQSGAPAPAVVPAAVPIASGLAAARKLANEQVAGFLEANPHLKRAPRIIVGMSDAAFLLTDSIADLPATEQALKLKAAIREFLDSAEIKPQVAALVEEDKAKRAAYQRTRMQRIEDQARAILNTGVYKTLYAAFQAGKIKRPPLSGLDLKRLETKKQSGPLSNEEIAALKEMDSYNSFPTDADMLGNPIARAIRRMLLAEEGSTTALDPDTVIDGLDGPALWVKIAAELESVRRGYEVSDENRYLYPDMYEDLDDGEIAALEAQYPEKYGTDPDRLNTPADFIERKLGDTVPIGKKIAIARKLATIQLKSGPPTVKTETSEESVAREESATGKETLTIEELDLAALDAQIDQAIEAVLNPPIKAQAEAKPKELTPKAETKPQTPAPAKTPAAPQPVAKAKDKVEDDGSVFAAIENGNEVATRPSSSVLARVQRWISSMPGFQGGKREMAAPVTAAIEAAFSPEKRASFTKAVDFFGGGGNWGIFNALTSFPNIRDLTLYERNADRILKIRLFHEKGNLVGEMFKQKNVRDILENAAAKMRQSGVKSGSALAVRINTSGISDPLLLGLFQAVRDYAENSYAGATDADGNQTPEQKIATSIRIIAEQAALAYKAAEAFRQRGGAISYRNADSYQSAATEGNDVLSLVDPPYYLTKGYTFAESVPDLIDGTVTESVTETIVGDDTYAQTRDLLARAAAAGNAIIYTDSAWWKTSSGEETPYFDLPAKARPLYLPTGRAILSDIVDLFDSFGVVAGEIGAGRKEILGIHGHDITTQPGRRTRPQRDARNNEGQGSPDRRDDQPGGRGNNPREAVQGMAEGTPKEADSLRSERSDPLAQQAEEQAAGELPESASIEDIREAAPTLTDTALVEALRKPDEAAFTGWLKSFSPALHRFAKKIWAAAFAFAVAITGINVAPNATRAEVASVVAISPELQPIELTQPAPGRMTDAADSFEDFTSRSAANNINLTVDTTLADISSLDWGPAAIVNIDQPAPLVEIAATPSAGTFQESTKQIIEDFKEEIGPDSYRLGVKLPQRIAEGWLKTDTSPAVAHLATMLGDREGSSARIKAMLVSMGIKQDPRTFPWCTTSVSWALTKAGERQQTASARSYLSKGTKVSKPAYGDVVVLWNDNPATGGQKGWGGHAGFYLGETDGRVVVLSGNANDEVNVTAFDEQRVLGYRRMTPKQPTLASTSLYSAPQSMFFSALEQALEAKLPRLAPPAQVMQIAASGAKAEEVKWSGLEQTVQRLASENNGKVPKDQLLDHLRNEGRVQFHEVVMDDQRKRTTVENDGFVEFVGGPEAGRGTRYAQYVLPGGENYREVVLAIKDPRKEVFSAYDSEGLFRGTHDTREAAEARAGNGGKVEPKFAAGQKAPAQYTSSHFPDVQDYVAHMRTNERDGGLFIEELQSDRHQAGRKQGYNEDIKVTLESLVAEGLKFVPFKDFDGVKGVMIEDDFGNEFAGGLTEEVAMRSLEKKRKASSKGVPDAPFRTTWPLALFKRALRDAVAGGKDWIGWTVGETQNDRFDLSKQVSKIVATPSESRPGMIRIEVYTLSGNPTIDKTVPPEELPDLVGKDLAQKIVDDIANPIPAEKIAEQMGIKLEGSSIRWRDNSVSEFNSPEDAAAMVIREFNIDFGNSDRAGVMERVYKGVDLKVGGEGMQGFYDQILPKEIGKYVRKWSTSVEKTTIDTTTADPEQIAQQVELAAENAQGLGDDFIEQMVTEAAARIAGAMRDDGMTYAQAMAAERQHGDDGAADYISNVLAGKGIHEQNNATPKSTPIWKVAITPEMRASVSQGQALYSAPQSKEWTPEEIADLQKQYDDHAKDVTANFKKAFTPLDPKNLFGEWGASLKEDNVVIGYRGENGNGQADNGFGASEGQGLYIAKAGDDTAFFGKARQVSFPKPKNPVVVDEDAGTDTLPLLNEESPIWEDILAYRVPEGASNWIKAHVLAAKKVGLTEDTWGERMDDFTRALTDELLAMGHDAVYVRSGGMEWVVILAKLGERFNRGTRTAGGTSLYSAPQATPQDQWYRANRSNFIHINLRGNPVEGDRDFSGWVLSVGDEPVPLANAMNTRYGKVGAQAVLVPKEFVTTSRSQPNKIKPGFRPSPEQIATITQDAINPNGTVNWAKVFLASASQATPQDQYAHKFLTEKLAKTGSLTPQEHEKLISIEKAIGQTHAFDLDDPALKSRKRGTVTRNWQQSLMLEMEDAYEPKDDRQMSLFSAPVRDLLTSSFADLPNPDNFQSYDERRTILREIARENGIKLVRPTHPHHAAAREFEQATGARLYYFIGDQGNRAGFVSRLSPSLIFLNVEQQRFPLGWVIAHELIHVAQKDRRFTLGGIYRRVMDQLTAHEKSEAIKHLMNAGYARHTMKTELPAHIIADVMFGQQVFDVDNFTNGAAIKQSLTEWADALPSLNPEPLKNAPDDELSRLYSAPQITPDLIEAALAPLTPMHRQVFHASQANPTPAPDVLARRFSIPERAVQNILGQVRTRIRTLTESQQTGGLAPATNRDGLLLPGRPERAMSTNPVVARAQQIRAEEDIPVVISNAETYRAARQMIAEDRQGTLEKLISRRANQETMTLEEVAAAQLFLRELGPQDTDPKVRLQLAWLASDWIDQGTDDARRLQIRRDVTHNPAERAALYFKNFELTPQDAATRKAMSEAKTRATKEAILLKWFAKVDGIKAKLKADGIDIDASMAALDAKLQAQRQAQNEASARHSSLVRSLEEEADRLQQQAEQLRAALATAQGDTATARQQAAEAELRAQEAAGRAQQAAQLDPKATLRLELEKLPMNHRAAIENIGAGGTLDTAAMIAGTTPQNIRRIYEKFRNSLNDAGRQAAKLAQDIQLGRLASASLSAAAGIDYAAAIGWPTLAEVDRVTAGKPRGKTSTRKSTPAPKVDPPMMSDAEFARRIANPVTPQELAQGYLLTEHQRAMAKLPPGKRISFDAWIAQLPATRKSTIQQDLGLKTVVGGTSTKVLPTDNVGLLDFTDPVSIKKGFEAFANETGTVMDSLLDFRRMAILSGFQTPVVNTTSAAMLGLYFNARKPMEALVNAALRPFGVRSDKAATFSEFPSVARAIPEAAAVAARQMITAWKLETRDVDNSMLGYATQLGLGDPTGGTHHEAVTKGRFAGNFIKLPIPTPKGIRMVSAGDIMRGITYRQMTAADSFITAFNGHLGAVAMAHRIAAIREKLTGTAYDERVAELMLPGSEAMIQGFREGSRATSTQSIGIGKNGWIGTTNPKPESLTAHHTIDIFVDAVANLVNSWRKKRFGDMRDIGPMMVDIAAPFVATPANLYKEAARMTPLVNLALAGLDAIRAWHTLYGSEGRAHPEIAQQRAKQIWDSYRTIQEVTNQIISLGVLYLIASYAAGSGDEPPLITGTEPWKQTDREARDTNARVMKPMSIRIPGTDLTFSYARMDPFATAIASTIDMVANRKMGMPFGEQVARFFTSQKNQVKEKTMLDGLSRIIAAVEAPDRNAERYLADLAVSMVPNAIRQPMRELDPYVRDTTTDPNAGFAATVADRAVKGLLPMTAPARIDPYGKPVERRTPGKPLIAGPIDRLLSVIDPTHMARLPDAQPLDRYLFDYNATVKHEDRIGISPIDAHVETRKDGKTTKLPITPQERQQATARAAERAVKFLGTGWESKPVTQEGAERIKDIFSKFQRMETERLRQQKLRSAPPR